MDRDAAIREMDIPADFYDELLGDFKKEADEALRQLGAAAKACDVEVVGKVAHKVKGTAAALKIHEVHEAAMLVDSAFKENKNDPAIWGLVDEFKRVLQEVLAELRRPV